MTDRDFSSNQQAFIRQTAFEVGEQVAERLLEKFNSAIVIHASTCPQAKAAAQAGGGWAVLKIAGAIFAWLLAMGVAVAALICGGKP